MKRIHLTLAAFAAVVFAAAAHAESCRNTLPLEDHSLTQEEVRTCLQARANALIALRLLGERQIVWSDYGTLLHKCSGDSQQELSEDPLVWAVQVSSCPSPRKTCGCISKQDMTVGSRPMPDNPSAQPQSDAEAGPGQAKPESLRAANLALIKHEAIVINKKINSNCPQIEAALRAMPDAKVRMNCRGLKHR